MVLKLNDFVGHSSVVEAPQGDALAVDSEAVASRSVKHLQDVPVLKEFLEAAGSQESPVQTGSEQVDLSPAGLDLNQAEGRQSHALKFERHCSSTVEASD